MSASAAATPIPAPTPVPAPAAQASGAPPSKPPTPAGGTLTPIVAAPPSNGGARVYNAIYSSVQVYECMVRGIAVMRRRVDSYVNATQILKVAGIDKGRRTKILEKEILPGRHEIVQGGYGKYQGTWIPLERGKEVATQFGVLPLLQPLFDYVPPTATMPSMVGLRPPPTLFYPPGTTFPAYSLGAQALQLTYPPAPGAALSILQQGRSAGLFTPTATFSALPPGFQFSHMGYGIPTTIPGQPAQPSIISVTPTPKGALAEVRTGSVTPVVNTPAARPSPAPPTTTESQAGQKRPRSTEGAQDAKTAATASKAAKAKQAPTVSGVGGSAATLTPNDDRASKRQRLERQRSDAMDLTADDSQPVLSQQASETQGTIVGSQATIPDSQASLDPGPSSPPLPVVEPNGIHPLPLTILTLNKPITDLPDAKARVSTKPPQRTRPLGPGDRDFGVENENLQVPVADDYIAALRTGPSPPVQKSHDVIAELTEMINNLSSEFSAEVAVKQKDLDQVQVELRNATRQLAEQRKQIQECQNRLSQLDQVHQRIQNVERVLKEEDTFDWTGRSTVDGKPEMNAGKAFQHRGPQSVLGPLTGKATSAELPPNMEPDPAFPPSGSLGGNSDTVATWMRLKRMKMWHTRMDDLMAQRIEGSKGASAEKELQCRKVVSLCTGVPVDEVDGMLENLVIAMESDGQVVDLVRVAGFMQKVKIAQ
ncbi:transcriptional regulator swi6 [Tulasnella sp. 408]|nr:transcriptional regulator swi6 [Tulasnella sp. 408]